MKKYNIKPGDIFKIDGTYVLVRYAVWCSEELQFHDVITHDSYSDITEGVLLKSGKFVGNILKLIEKEK